MTSVFSGQHSNPSIVSERLQLLRDVWTGKVSTVTHHPQKVHWPEIIALASTPQDPEWHAEGDVLIHTDMVLSECAKITNEFSNETERQTIRLACLLHDIAKPGRTRFDPEVNHVIAPGHERAGGVQTRYLLHGSGLAHPQRRLIAELVATHHLVKRSVKSFDQPDGPGKIDRLAQRVDTRLLWALELADMRGRIAVDRDNQIEIVELFRMLCEERNVFGKQPTPWLTPNDVGHIAFASEETQRWALAECFRRQLLGTLQGGYHAEAFCHQNAKHKPAEVVVTMGVSGSGKSHRVQDLDSNYERISTDDVREELYGDASVQGDPGSIFSMCFDKLRVVLRRGGKAVFDATNIIADQRNRVTSLCHDYNAYVRLWVFDVPRPTIEERNRSRERRVPSDVIARQMEKFEWPLPEEVHSTEVFDG